MEFIKISFFSYKTVTESNPLVPGSSNFQFGFNWLINCSESVHFPPDLCCYHQAFHSLMTVIMVINRTGWVDVLPFGLETLQYDGRLLTLLKIDIRDLRELQLGVLDMNLGFKMQDSVQNYMRCLFMIDSVHVQYVCAQGRCDSVSVCWRNRLISVWGVTGMARRSDCRAGSTELGEEEEEEEEGMWLGSGHEFRIQHCHLVSVKSRMDIRKVYEI